MRIAISANGANLSAQVDPRFGRCQYFIIVDPQTLEFEAVENASKAAGGGAGIASAQTVVNKGIEAVLTGNCGPNAHQVLSAAGISVITGVSGTVKDAIEGYHEGRFKASPTPTVEAHFGMGSGGDACDTAPPMAPKEEIQAIKAETQVLKDYLSDIQRRIADLEKKAAGD